MNTPHFLTCDEIMTIRTDCLKCGAEARGDVDRVCRRHGTALIGSQAFPDETEYWCPVCEIERLEGEVADLANVRTALAPLAGRWPDDELNLGHWVDRLVDEFLGDEAEVKVEQDPSWQPPPPVCKTEPHDPTP